MAPSIDLGPTGLARSARAAAIAGAATFALSGYTWWSARGDVPTPDVSAVIVLLIPVGVAAGLASGRFRDSAVSWLAAFAGSVLAYGVTNLIDPGLPDPHSSFTGHELLNAAFLLPFVGGGHLLGVWAGTASRRSRLGAVFAGLGICALCLLGLWSYEAYGPGGTPALVVWATLAAWVGVGVGAGLISGRTGDAPASWAAAVAGFMVVYLIFYGIPQGSSGPMETLLYTPVILLLFIAGGHLLGTAIGAVARRSLGRAGA
jgi:hypothetical protein